METLYRRPLPDDTVAFASPAGQAIFGEALASGGLGGYFALAEQFHTQAEPAFCGLGSLVVALNALAIDPGRLWKGPWRWFSEELLDCCESLEEVRARGVELETLACLARCNGAEVEVARPGADAGPLRAAIRAATASPTSVLIAGYDRSTLGQTGAGHYSPIGGYHAGRDLALVLDVARFKYPPHWVAIERLDAAMRPLDPATGRSRGWLTLRRRSAPSTIGASLTCRGATWADLRALLARSLTTPWPEAATVRDVARAAAALAAHVAWRSAEAPAHDAAVGALRAAVERTEAYRVAIASDGAAAEPAATALALLVIAQAQPPAAPALASTLAALVADAETDPLVAAELRHLSTQAAAVLEHR